jgi:hypothetical protein
MYFSSSNPSTNFSLYKSILDGYLEDKKDDDVRKLFEKVIITTHQLVTNELPESRIDHKIYNLVIALSDIKNTNTRQYFSNINPSQIGIDQFRSLSGILHSMSSLEGTSLNA